MTVSVMFSDEHNQYNIKIYKKSPSYKTWTFLEPNPEAQTDLL